MQMRRAPEDLWTTTILKTQSVASVTGAMTPSATISPSFSFNALWMATGILLGGCTTGCTLGLTRILFSKTCKHILKLLEHLLLCKYRRRFHGGINTFRLVTLENLKKTQGNTGFQAQNRGVVTLKQIELNSVFHSVSSGV